VLGDEEPAVGARSGGVGPAADVSDERFGARVGEHPPEDPIAHAGDDQRPVSAPHRALAEADAVDDDFGFHDRALSSAGVGALLGPSALRPRRTPGARGRAGPTGGTRPG